VVIIDGNDFVFACLLKSEDYVRGFRESQCSIGGGEVTGNANQCSRPRL
jgi:hypothetical protein